MSTDAASRPTHIVILAAGKGTRMGTPNRAKVLTPLANRPLLDYVLTLSATIHPASITVVVGHQRDAVEHFVATHHPQAQCVVQSQQLGTGHAVQQARPLLNNANGNLLILSGDVPLLSHATLANLLTHHANSGATLSMLTTTLANPHGYGRIVRDEGGTVQRIVEQKDATPSEQAINEINAGIYVAHSSSLFNALDSVSNANAQGEFYLTDVVGILLGHGERIEAVNTPHSQEVHGVNSPEDLAAAEDFLAATAIAP